MPANSQVYVEGKLQTRKWQDKDGKDQYTTEIIVERLQLLGGRPQQGEQNNSRQPDSKPQSSGYGGGAKSNYGGNSSFPEDDIPFCSCDIFDEPLLKKMRLAADF